MLVWYRNMIKTNVYHECYQVPEYPLHNKGAIVPKGTPTGTTKEP